MISANAAMTGSYDYSEVARSVLIAILASYAALDLAERVTAARGWVRSAWLTGGAAAMGLGIWAMHFKGMLAFHLPVPVSYHWPTVVLSLLVAVLASAFALYVVSRQKLSLVRAFIGSLIMGGGIAGMHYIGMAAMRLPAVMRFHPFVVTLSVVLAIVFSLISLMLAFGLREESGGLASRKIASAIVMGAAVSAMHYTGMASVSFLPSAVLPNLTHAASISSLGSNGIAIVTVIVLAAAVLTSSVDRQAEAELRHLNEELEHRVVERTSKLVAVNEELKKLKDELRLVINTIPTMVWSALPDGSVDFVNQRWLDYFGLPPEKILGRAWIDAIHPEDRASTIKKWSAAFASGEPVEIEARLRRGDGEYRRFVTCGVPLRDELGNIVKWYGTKTDVEDRRRAEEDLRESETRLRAFFKNSPNLIFMKDPQGRYLYVNQEVEKVLRITEEQIKGKRDDEVFPQEQAVAYQAAAYQANDLQVLQAGIPMEFEEIFVKEDGPHTTIVQKFPLFNVEGAIYAIGGVATDITERIREEAALRYSEERYRVVVETANDAVVSIDQSGDILLANPATTTVFGYEPSELIGQPLTILMPEYLRHLHEAGFKRYLDTGQRHMNWHGTELIGLRKNGGEFPVEVSFGEVTKDGHRVFTGFIRDITDRKRAEEALRKSEERWRSVFENSAIGVALTDLKGRFLATNHVYQKMVGYTEEELRALSFLDLTREDYREANWALVTELLEGKRRQFQIEKKYRRKDGSLIWVSNNVSLVPGSERVPRFVMALSEDITERKRTESALREAHAELARVTRIATMGELTASIAHEVNQPLAAVVTNGNAALRWLAGQSPNLDEAREAIDRTIRDANRASDVIGGIRAMLQRTSPRTERLDMNPVIREALTLAENELLRGGVAVKLELAPDVPTVFGDRVQLQQVMLNLILNGIDAMSTLTERPRELLIKSARHPDGLLVQVHDSGIGVEPDQTKRIFESFFTTKPGGIGMGLPISRSIVQSHGGRLWVESGSNGALFQFTLPKAN